MTASEFEELKALTLEVRELKLKLSAAELRAEDLEVRHARLRKIIVRFEEAVINLKTYIPPHY